MPRYDQQRRPAGFEEDQAEVNGRSTKPDFRSWVKEALCFTVLSARNRPSTFASIAPRTLARTISANDACAAAIAASVNFTKAKIRTPLR